MVAVYFISILKDVLLYSPKYAVLGQILQTWANTALLAKVNS